MIEEELQELRAEFEMEPFSFLATASEGQWAEERFNRLLYLMHTACHATTGEDTCEKWLAAGFYELDSNFDRYFPAAYIIDHNLLSDIHEHFMLLASWFFSDTPPMEPSAFDEELQLLLKRGSAFV